MGLSKPNQQIIDIPREDNDHNTTTNESVSSSKSFTVMEVYICKVIFNFLMFQINTSGSLQQRYIPTK